MTLDELQIHLLEVTDIQVSAATNGLEKASAIGVHYEDGKCHFTEPIYSAAYSTDHTPCP